MVSSMVPSSGRGAAFRAFQAAARVASASAKKVSTSARVSGSSVRRPFTSASGVFPRAMATVRSCSWSWATPAAYSASPASSFRRPAAS